MLIIIIVYNMILVILHNYISLHILMVFSALNLNNYFFIKTVNVGVTLLIFE